MAQFQVPQKYVGQQQPVVFSSQVGQQQQMNVLPPRQYGENVSLLKKECTLASKAKKFLFYGPLLFFLILVVFSSVVYALRWDKANNTTPAAVQVLENFGNDLERNPIIHLLVFPKYKGGKQNAVLSECDNTYITKKMAGPSQSKHYKRVVFNEFAAINDGCVCRRTRYNRNILEYHDAGYCETDLVNCKLTVAQGAQNEHYLLDHIFCVRRSTDFQWRNSDDQVVCKDKKDKFENPMRSCGDNYCLSIEKDAGPAHAFTLDNKYCPYTRLKIQKYDTGATPTYTAKNYKKVINTPRENHKFTKYMKTSTPLNTADTFLLADRMDVTGDLSGGPIIHLVTTISNPRCLSADLQRPLRNSHRYFKLQETRETGCWPYGAHLSRDFPRLNSEAQQNSGSGNTVKVTYFQTYTDQIEQLYHFGERNNDNAQIARIPFWNSDIVTSADQVQFYSQVRPILPIVKQLNVDVCQLNNIKYTSQKARDVISVLTYVEYYTLVFIYTSAFGFALALAFVVMRSKNIVNNTTQFYVQLFAFANAVALFVYPIIFWVKQSQHGTREVGQDLEFFQSNGCFMYAGQNSAAEHLHAEIKQINNEIYGLTTFLFVFDCVYIVLVLAAVWVRKHESLALCEPVKGDQLYYE